MTDREKVIKGLEQIVNDPFMKARADYWVLVCSEAIVLLKEQEPKTGHWIDSAGNDKCSVCGATYSDLYPDYQHTHYCPNCGAKMT